MLNLMLAISRPEDVVTIFCADAYSTARACFLLDQHKRFVKCGVDSELLTAADEEIVLALDGQVPTSHILHQWQQKNDSCPKSLQGQESCAFSQQKRLQCAKFCLGWTLGKYCWVIFRTSSQIFSKNSFMQDVPTPCFTHMVAGTAEPGLLHGAKTFHDKQVQPARCVSRERQEWAVRLPEL